MCRAQSILSCIWVVCVSVIFVLATRRKQASSWLQSTATYMVGCKARPYRLRSRNAQVRNQRWARRGAPWIVKSPRPRAPTNPSHPKTARLGWGICSLLRVSISLLESSLTRGAPSSPHYHTRRLVARLPPRRTDGRATPRHCGQSKWSKAVVAPKLFSMLLLRPVPPRRRTYGSAYEAP